MNLRTQTSAPPPGAPPSRLEVVTTGVRRYLRKLQYASDRGRERPIYITHVTRDDIALGFLAHFQKARHASGE